MKSLLFTAIILSFVCAAISAQTNEISPCPAIKISGPAGDVLAGETMTFTVGVDENYSDTAKYEWSVSDGKIIEGQGSSSIKVATIHAMMGVTVTATVKIKGLPENCVETFSRQAVIFACDLLENDVDEFSLPAARIDKAKLDIFAVKLQKSPFSQAYIVEKYAGKSPPKNIEQRNQKIVEYLKFREIERDRITLLNCPAAKNLTQLVLVPLGTSPPDCGIF